MKLRRILSTAVAAVMAMTTFTVSAFTVNAADYTGGVTLAYNSGDGSNWGYFSADFSTWNEFSLDGVTYNSMTVAELADTYEAITASITPASFTAGAGLAGLNSAPALTNGYVRVELSLAEEADGDVVKVNWNNPVAGTSSKFTAIGEEATSTLDLTTVDAAYENYIVRDITVVIGMDFGDQADVSGATGDKSVTFTFADSPVIEGVGDYVAPTTDVWNDNGDGSWTYITTDDSISNLSLPYNGTGVVESVSVDLTIEGGYAGGGLGANVNGAWASKGSDGNFTNGTFTWSDINDTISGLEFQTWWTAAGTTITVSNLVVTEATGLVADRAYVQLADDGEGTQYARIVMKVDAADAEAATRVKFDICYEGDTADSQYTTCYYTSITSDGDEIAAEDGYVYVAVVLTGVPADATATDFAGTAITLETAI